ncbi:MAG: aryl-sulfate sulfotransferase [Cyclobacteriaceae bacterium]|nr:aryl-sulfate sulfotransferase [Cyclobacteriaceae bacterium]
MFRLVFLLSPFFLFLMGSCTRKGDSAPYLKSGTIPELSDHVVVYNPDLVDPGFVLAVEGGSKQSYLLDKSGTKLFTWNFSSSLGNDFELLPNGMTLGMFKKENPVFSFGGGYGGYIKLINPDTTIQWQYEYASENYLAHHDVVMLPNGNILFLAWERINAHEAKLAGVKTSQDIFPEKIVEVDTATNQIVWEWRSWDHIVQDTLTTAPTFGSVADNPAKIDINFVQQEDGDIMHANGLAYDADRDVIFISVNYFSEIWVIDHSTTRSEAATDRGGAYHRGGDLLYRLGNPQAFGKTDSEPLFDRIHSPVLIEKGLPGAGNLLVYVNGLSAKKSVVYEFALPATFRLDSEEYQEPTVVWSFADNDLFYGRISGASRLPNGNTLICEGDYGFWEVTNKGTIAWKYKDQSTTFWRALSYAPDDAAIGNLNLQE